MSHLPALTAELGRLALDLADRAYTEGRADDADRFIQLAFTIFEQAVARPARQPPRTGQPPPS